MVAKINTSEKDLKYDKNFLSGIPLCFNPTLKTYCEQKFIDRVAKFLYYSENILSWAVVSFLKE